VSKENEVQNPMVSQEQLNETIKLKNHESFPYVSESTQSTLIKKVFLMVTKPCQSTVRIVSVM
jgi:hypothetical protein